MDVSITSELKNPWAIGKDRIEDGTSRRQRQFWDREVHEICPGRCNEMDVCYLSIGNWLHGRM